MCGNVNENLVGETITVSGWVSINDKCYRANRYINKIK